MLRELLRVECGAHEDDFEVVPEAEQVLHDDEQHVRLQVSLVDFVQHEVTDAGQKAVLQAPKNIERNVEISAWFQVQ